MNQKNKRKSGIKVFIIPATIITVLSLIILLFTVTKPTTPTTEHYQVSYSEYYHVWVITDVTVEPQDPVLFVDNIKIYQVVPSVMGAKYIGTGDIYYENYYTVILKK